MSAAADKRRYHALKAVGKCVTCAISKAVEGRVRCYSCQQNLKQYYALRGVGRYSPSEMTPEVLYQAVRHEREVVSWCWKFPPGSY